MKRRCEPVTKIDIENNVVNKRAYQCTLLSVADYDWLLFFLKDDELCLFLVNYRISWWLNFALFIQRSLQYSVRS